jgi:hypothetical protein
MGQKPKISKRANLVCNASKADAEKAHPYLTEQRRLVLIDLWDTGKSERLMQMRATDILKQLANPADLLLLSAAMVVAGPVMAGTFLWSLLR